MHVKKYIFAKSTSYLFVSEKLNPRKEKYYWLIIAK